MSWSALRRVKRVSDHSRMLLTQRGVMVKKDLQRTYPRESML
jgi:hypothetical protein